MNAKGKSPMHELIEAAKAGDFKRAKQELAKIEMEPDHNSVMQLVSKLRETLPGTKDSEAEEGRKNHALKSRLVGVITSEMILRKLEGFTEEQKGNYRDGLVRYLASEKLKTAHGVKGAARKKISSRIIRQIQHISEQVEGMQKQRKISEQQGIEIRRHLADGGKILTVIQM